MYKKLISVFMTLMILISVPAVSSAAKRDSGKPLSYATETDAPGGEKDPSASNSTAKNGGKVIVIDMDRTNFNGFSRIRSIREIAERYGYVGLMNIRGDHGYDDARNYATMGATGRVDIDSTASLDFSKDDPKQAEIYKAATGAEPQSINLVNINAIDYYNQNKGEYKSKMGYLGQTLENHGKKIAVLGNSDYYDGEGRYVKNRAFCLAVMDTKGRLKAGNVDSINRTDLKMPFGISTDYDKLIKETKDYYSKSDLLFIELGDTFRLDEYKQNLNNSTYSTMRRDIYTNIDRYLKQVFDMASKDDTIYILGSFPSKLDYANNRRMGSVIRIDRSDNDSTGLLVSSTTRRDGIISNMDIGVDILNRFGLKNKEMNGRVIRGIEQSSPLKYIDKLYNKIVVISSIRIDIINIYVIFISLSWCIAALCLWQKNRIPKKYRNRVLKIMKELVKFGLIMPLAFLSAPIFGASSAIHVSVVIVVLSILYYLLASILFRDQDIKQIGFYAVVMILLITVDSVISTPLMKGNIMSYDAMIGARYYGVGNEYEGVTIGSAILGMAVLLQYKKIPKWCASLFLFIILITSAYPSMGANVGGAISESIAYLTFVLLIYNIKIDAKKVIGILLSAAALVILFAVADIGLGLGSHLGNFVQNIRMNGPMEVINVFARKISMNVELAQTTIWVNILLVGLVLLAVCILKPNKTFRELKNDEIIYKGYIATIVGCFVTLLVNDSGIIAAATDSIYLLIPMIIVFLNKEINRDKENRCLKVE